jgi:hypothetical protein
VSDLIDHDHVYAEWCRYAIEVHLGTQVDPFFDDPAKVESLKELWNKMTSAVNISLPLKFYRIPLSQPFLDITFKYNELIKYAYEDGCEYIYQWSDDHEMLTSGSLDTLVQMLNNQQNFGLTGMFEMLPWIELALIHRTHIDIFGSYWPRSQCMKNYYSDIWAHYVYHKYTIHDRNIKTRNVKTHSTRYMTCACNREEMINLYVQTSGQVATWLERNSQLNIDSALFRNASSPAYWQDKPGTALPDWLLALGPTPTVG